MTDLAKNYTKNKDGSHDGALQYSLVESERNETVQQIQRQFGHTLARKSRKTELFMQVGNG